MAEATLLQQKKAKDKDSGTVSGSNEQSEISNNPSSSKGKVSANPANAGKAKTTTSSRKTVTTPPPSTSAGSTGFNQECLLILREMNSNINKTNNKVEQLTQRVDNLYEGEEQFFDYEYPYSENNNNYEQYDELGQDCVSVISSNTDKRSFDEVEDDDEDIFTSFIKKFKKADKVDPEVNQKIADMINATFREGMPDDIYNEVIKGINRPENCFALKETRVNAGVWSVLKPQTQTEDSKMRGIQNAICKAGSNFAKLLDKGEQHFDKEMKEWGSTALALLGKANIWINTRRRELHKKDMHPSLHYLCSPNIPFTDQLYGDSMIKDIKDIQEINKISRNVARGRGRGRGGRFSRPASRGSYQRGFRRGQHHSYKEGTGTRPQKSEQKKEFKAGRLSMFEENWRKLTNDPRILDIVRNCHLEFNDTPVQSTGSYPMHFSKFEEDIIDSEIQKLLGMNVLEKVSYDKNQFLSPIFTRPKKDGEYRMILNLKELNQYIEYHHFKMDSFETALKLVRKDCYMASVDLRHAYYSVCVSKEERKLLRFIWKGQIYEYTCLANGIGSAPRLFTKLMKPVYAALRKKGHTNSGYIDDSLLLADTKQECEHNVQDTVSLMKEVGFIIHDKKSVLFPVQNIVFLGNHIDSEKMIVYLPSERKDRILQACKNLRQKYNAKIRDVARVIGFIVSAFSAVELGPLHYRILETHKITALRCNAGNFNATMGVTSDMKAELDWWIANLPNAHRKISHGSPQLLILADASSEGWGAICNSIKIGGRWSAEERRHHINYLELLAIYHGLRAFCKDKHDLHIQIKSDNVCAVTCIKKMGSIGSPLCNELVKTIWNWATRKQIWLTSAHIPGIQNDQADYESRHFNDNIEWMLKPSLAGHIMNIWGKPNLDMFASRLNKQLDRFVSWKNDPDAEFIDAFSMIWTDIYFYAFPPFSLIPRLLAKLQEEESECILIAPIWITQTWFPVVMGMLIDSPYIIPKEPNLLTLPGTQKVHPLDKKLFLMACRLSGKTYKTETFRQGLPESSWPHGGRELNDSITSIFENGFRTVIKNRLVVFKFL